MFAILKRELNAYFNSPIIYVCMGIFFIFTGIFFMSGNILPRPDGNMMGQSGGYNDFAGTLFNLFIILAFIIPIITMRLISEEQKSKTLQLLYTSPTSVSRIVIGKYLSALIIFLVMNLVSFIYPLILFKYSDPSLSHLASAYLGFFLIGGIFISISLFMSSLTESQGVAAILSIGTILILWLIQMFQELVKNEAVKEIFGWLALTSKHIDYLKGIISIPSLVYSLSFIVVFIFFTIRRLEKRRWSEG